MTQTAKLTTTDTPTQSYFGCSVAISGDTIVVGAKGIRISGPYQGSAYVFAKPGTSWTDMTETAKLRASDGAASDNFGISVAISGDTVVVGAVYGGTPDTGTAYVFLRGSGWSGTRTENAKLTASDGIDGASFGQSVAISGDTVVVGANDADLQGNYQYQGAAYVFVRPAGYWADTTQNAKLIASDAAFQDSFGLSVAIDDDTIVVGTKYSHSSYVFIRPPLWVGTLTENAKLVKSDGTAFSWARVAISGDTVVVGSLLEGVYVYVKPGSWSGTRTEDVQLTTPVGAGSFAGGGVAISSDTIVVGAPSDMVGTNRLGSAFVGRWVAGLHYLFLPLITK